MRYKRFLDNPDEQVPRTTAYYRSNGHTESSDDSGSSYENAQWREVYDRQSTDYSESISSESISSNDGSQLNSNASLDSIENDSASESVNVAESDNQHEFHEDMVMDLYSPSVSEQEELLLRNVSDHNDSPDFEEEDLNEQDILQDVPDVNEIYGLHHSEEEDLNSWYTSDDRGQ